MKEENKSSGATGKISSMQRQREMRFTEELWTEFNATFPVERIELKEEFLRQKVMFEATLNIREILLLLLNSGQIISRDSIPGFIKTAIPDISL